MSLIDALLKDFLRKKGKLPTEQPELEEQIPPHLRIGLDTRYCFMLWNIGVTQAAVYKKFAKELGWKKVEQLLTEAFLEWMEEFINSEEMKPALDLFKKMAGKGKNPDAATFSKIVTLYDYILGNYDLIPESSTKKMIGRNLYCHTWHLKTLGGLENKISCAPVCFAGMQLLAKTLNPKLKITGSRDGKEIGVPGVGFNKNRNAGDDYCECEIILED